MTPTRVLPPSDPAHLHPELCYPPIGSEWFRFLRAGHRNPLSVGSAASRFSDPAVSVGVPPRFNPLYLGATFSVCFLETLLRDEANGLPGFWPLAEAELSLWTCATIVVSAPISLVDLRGDAAVRNRISSDALHASDQTLGRVWSGTFYAHPERPDGLAYHSRLNGEECVALYLDGTRPASPRLTCVRRTPVLDMEDELAATLDRFQVALV